MYSEKHSRLAVSLLCVICDRDQVKAIGETLEARKMLFSLVALGKGTASSKLLSYLGLGEAEKAVFFCVLETAAALDASAALDKRLQFDRPGHGISFLSTMRRGSYHAPIEFVNKEDESMEKGMTHNLIFVVLNRGYSEDVMGAARAAGATGGTVLHARGCGLAGMEKFFGMVIAPEKELILMVAEERVSIDIMSAIGANSGPETDAAAVSFSLPVSHVNGISGANIQL